MPSYRYHRTNDVVMVRTEVANGRSYGSDPRVWAMHYHAVVVVRTINAGVVVAGTGLVAAMVPAGAIAAVVVVVVPAGAIAAVVVVVVPAGAIATIVYTMVPAVVAAAVVAGAIVAVIIVVTMVTAVVAAAVVAGAVVAIVAAAVVVTITAVVIGIFLSRIEGSAYAVAARLRCALVATVVAVGVDSGVISVGLGPVACFRAIGAHFAAIDGSGIGV